MAIEKRKRSSLAVLDTAALVFVGLLVAFAAFKVVGWVLGTVFFVVKLAVVALVVAVVIRLLGAVRRR